MLAAMIAGAVYTVHISHGIQGVRETVDLMARLAREAREDPDVIETARMVTLGAPYKDQVGEALALFEFVRSEIRYVNDPRDCEVIATPAVLLELKSGDCDDMALLLGSLLEAIGREVRFTAAGFDRSSLSHVFVEVFLNDAWVTLDATEPYPAGWRPPGIVTQYTVKV